jgi:hypothetical protein
MIDSGRSATWRLPLLGGAAVSDRGGKHCWRADQPAFAIMEYASKRLCLCAGCQPLIIGALPNWAEAVADCLRTKQAPLLSEKTALEHAYRSEAVSSQALTRAGAGDAPPLLWRGAVHMAAI